MEMRLYVPIAHGQMKCPKQMDQISCTTLVHELIVMSQILKYWYMISGSCPVGDMKNILLKFETWRIVNMDRQYLGLDIKQ